MANVQIILKIKLILLCFYRKTIVTTKYKESNIEKDKDLKNQFSFINLPDPISLREPASTWYVDIKFIDSSSKK